MRRYRVTTFLRGPSGDVYDRERAFGDYDQAVRAARKRIAEIVEQTRGTVAESAHGTVWIRSATRGSVTLRRWEYGIETMTSP